MLSVNNVCQIWPNAIHHIFFSCSFYREAYRKLWRENHSGNKADILSCIVAVYALSGHRVTSLCKSWGFCANVNYICVKCCLRAYAITSTLPCTLSCLSSWTVNVFCSVPFWSEIKILSWPENDPQNGEFQHFGSKGETLSWRELQCVLCSLWISPGPTQCPDTLCSCSCYCTCGGYSLTHWCTWSLDACRPIKIGMIQLLVSCFSGWPPCFEGEPSIQTWDSWGGAKPGRGEMVTSLLIQ